MASHHESRLLYSLNNVRAYHIQNGQESSITPSGAQTLSLLMVPTASSTHQGQEEDFYLHLSLPPELDISLPATTQIYPRPPRSYLIPQSQSSSGFIRIELPEKVSHDDVDTFETILAQCTAFMEHAPPPTGDASHQPYNPADWKAGGRLGGGKTQAGQVVLVDEDDGSVVGELGGGATIYEDPSLSHGSKNPVEIEISADGTRVDIRPASEEYLRLSRMPMYANSSLVQNAASASRLIVTSSSKLGGILTSQAEKYTQKSQPGKPVTFSPAAQERARKIHGYTQTGRELSAKTVGSVAKHAQNLAASWTGKGERKGKPEGYKPGLLNKSMIAFTTVMDGLAESGTRILTDSGNAATIAVSHKYGPDAGAIAGQFAGGVKNVGLVYVDVTGVSRRAIIKSVAKGMVVGKVKDKYGKESDVIVGAGDGGAIPEEAYKQAGSAQAGGYQDGASGTGYGGSSKPPPYSGGGAPSGYSEKSGYR